MKDLYKLFIAIISVIVIVFVIDRILGTYLDNNAVFIDQPKYKRITSASEEIVVLGASRAENQYVSQIIEDSLGTTVYNYGVGAQNVYTNYAVMNLLLNTSKIPPRVVIWDFYYTDIMDSPGWNTEKLYRLYTAYNYDDTVKTVINLQGAKKEFLLSNVKLYKFNSKLTRALFEDSHVKEGYKNKGYVGLNIATKDSLATYDMNRTVIDTLKISYIERMMKLCKENQIKLFVCISPCYYILPEKQADDWSNIIERMCKKENIPFFNYERDGLFLNHQDYFYNTIHLNDKGAKVYSSIIASEIKDCLSTDIDSGY